MPALKRLKGTRIASTPAALDAISWPDEAIVMRFAPDEVYLTPPLPSKNIVLEQDEHAIVIAEGSFSGVWIDRERALDLLQRLCEWELPSERPVFAQGAVAGIPTKLWFTEDQILFVVQSPYAAEMEERLA
ncbi:MAG: hypothetical protein QNJ45_13960 [Ardenticatenaceae bacterium]|nr:hypothetical protein [Ardenticatenaceae bacterium]